MTHEMALKLAQTETPEQIADRIVELYETIDDLRTNAERWERAWQRVVEERNDLRTKLATARYALEQAGRDICGCACALDHREGPHCLAHTDVMVALAAIKEE